MKTRYFYKVIIISIDTFESSIIDERHFATLRDARLYLREHAPAGNGMICRMSNDISVE